MNLHLGCGNVRVPGYINVDAVITSAVDVIADLRALPFSDGYASVIYAASVLEHFGRKEWRGVLRHWRDKLENGGTLRLSVPDFKAIIIHYIEFRLLSELLGLLIGGQKDAYDWHGMIFDFDLLRSGLVCAGFATVKRYDWRKRTPGMWGIDDYSQAYLPHMDKIRGRLMMLNVEARKCVSS